jgi:hypothetical protein
MNHIDAGHHLEQLASQMGHRAVASRRHIDLARIGLGVPKRRTQEARTAKIFASTGKNANRLAVNVRTITARGHLLVYALTAYLLNINKVIDNNDVMDSKSLPQVKMPNRDGSFPEFPKLMLRKSGIQFP